MTPEERTIRELVAKLDDEPDRLHNDITPAVLALGRLGLAVLPHLEGALLSGDELTRLHAQRALEFAVDHHFGFRPGRGYTPPDGEARAREAFEQNGRYDFEAPEPQRREAVAAWLRWVAARR